jgi:hypothetical protein
MNDVDEIMRFAETGPLLQPAGSITGERFRVIDDFDEAKEIAYERTISDDEDAMNWTDLRQSEAAEIRGATYSDPSLAPVRQAMGELLERLTEAVRPRVAPQYADIVDDIVADLRNVAFSRSVFGANERFFDLVWDAYRQGGWPCGWEGEFPTGWLIVYEP